MTDSDSQLPIEDMRFAHIEWRNRNTVTTTYVVPSESMMWQGQYHGIVIKLPEPVQKALHKTALGHVDLIDIHAMNADLHNERAGPGLRAGVINLWHVAYSPNPDHPDLPHTRAWLEVPDDPRQITLENLVLVVDSPGLSQPETRRLIEFGYR